jgi:hypothetical protein
MDGYDDCIVGIVERCKQSPIICYDKQKILEKHMEDGMNIDEAEEFFEYNKAGAWVGDKTPCFITKIQA